MGNVLKFVITGIPLLIFVLWATSPTKFKEVLVMVDSVQGPGGWVQINSKDQISVGQKFNKFLEETAPNASPQVKVYFSGVSGDVDRIANFFQDYWVWCAAAFVFLICIVMILRAKDYSK